MKTRRLAPVMAAAFLVQLFAWAAPVAAATPDAVDDAFVVQKDSTPNSLDVLGNDDAVAPAEITEVTDPPNGSVVITQSGLRVGYTPDPGYSGPDTFDYTVTDPVDGADTATVTIKVNAPPVAVDDPAVPSCNPLPNMFGGSFPIAEDYGEFDFIPGLCGATDNDSDADGTIASWHVDVGPAHGTMEWLPGFPGTFSYTPAPNFSTPDGDWPSDSFTYHVVDNDGASSNAATFRFWIVPINDAPSFTPGSLSISSPENAPYSAAWASDPDPGPLETDQTVHYLISDNPGNDLSLFSTLPSIADDGTLSFVPAPARTGTVLLDVVAKDDGGTPDYGNIGGPPADDTSDPVSLSITITDVGEPPLAVDDEATLDEDAGPTAIDVLGNDTDVDLDTLVITSKTDGVNGTVAISGGGTGLTYTPNANENGPDSFTYTIDDGYGGTDTARVDVTITPVNDDPVATDDVVTVTEDQGTATPVMVLTNDTDIEADGLTVTGPAPSAQKGTVTIATGGTSVTYKPFANAFGADTFTYTVSDGHGGSDTATVSVTINPVNDPPNAVNDGVPTPYTMYLKAPAKAIPVLANDTSAPDAVEVLTITKVTQGSHGVVAIASGGKGLTYTATGGATGLDVFTYTISDGHGKTDTASVQVKVLTDTSRPTAKITSVTKTNLIDRNASRIKVAWTLSDTGSGVKSQLFQRRIDGGSWFTISLASSARTYSMVIAHGHTVVFRVKGTDRAGNIGYFATSAPIRS